MFLLLPMVGMTKMADKGVLLGKERFAGQLEMIKRMEEENGTVDRKAWWIIQSWVQGTQRHLMSGNTWHTPHFPHSFNENAKELKIK